MKVVAIVVGLLSVSLVSADQAAPPPQISTPGQIGTPAPQTPARDPKQPLKGTAVLKGTVVDAQTGAPVRRASVDAFSPAGRGDAVTDGDGRFEIRELAAGKYMVSAMRPGYIRSLLGQRRIDGPGTTLELHEGQTLDKIVVHITRGGVISGRVFDEYGEPALGMEITAHQYRFVKGSRRLSPVFLPGGQVRTDDLGAFRLFGLSPGQYFVSAGPSGGPVRVNAPFEPTAPTKTFFPNNPDVSGAQRVTVRAGHETTAINISLVTGRLARVRGRAVMSTGEPFVGSTVNFAVRDEFSGYTMSTGQVAADGSFDVKGVTPGRYLLTVRPVNAREDDDVEVGRGWLTVTGDDIDDVVLVGSRGAIVRGTVVTDEGVPLPVPPSEVAIQSSPADEEQTPYVRPTPLKDDFSFELRGLFGRHRLSANLRLSPTTATGGPSAWSPKAIIWRGQDISDRVIEFDAGHVMDGVEIVFSRRWSEISGTVTDEDNEPVIDTWLVLFPADESHWTDLSRYVRATRPNADGSYAFSRLLPHHAYLLAAAPHIEQGQWQDPEFLRTLQDFATRISLADGVTVVQNLRVGR